MTAGQQEKYLDGSFIYHRVLGISDEMCGWKAPRLPDPVTLITTTRPGPVMYDQLCPSELNTTTSCDRAEEAAPDAASCRWFVAA